MQPLATNASSSSTAPCTTHWWATVAPRPISVVTSGGQCSTEPSCTLARSRTTIGPQSPRSTAPYQIEAPDSTLTSPMSVAVGATNASSAIVGRLPRLIDEHRITLPGRLRCGAPSRATRAGRAPSIIYVTAHGKEEMPALWRMRPGGRLHLQPGACRRVAGQGVGVREPESPCRGAGRAGAGGAEVRRPHGAHRCRARRDLPYGCRQQLRVCESALERDHRRLVQGCHRPSLGFHQETGAAVRSGWPGRRRRAPKSSGPPASPMP